MKDKDQEHVYVSGNELTSKLYLNYFQKKNYFDYLTNTGRHLTGLATARLETLQSLV